MVSPPRPNCSGASHGPDRHGSALVTRRTNDTDGDCHNTIETLEPLSGRTVEIATLNVRIWWSGKVDRNFSLLAQHGGNSTMNSAVVNLRCGRTAGRITRSVKVVNRTLTISDKILVFLSRTPFVHAVDQSMLIGSTSMASSIPCGAGCSPGTVFASN